MEMKFGRRENRIKKIDISRDEKFRMKCSLQNSLPEK
jgi:hypothetical protein